MRNKGHLRFAFGGATVGGALIVIAVLVAVGSPAWLNALAQTASPTPTASPTGTVSATSTAPTTATGAAATAVVTTTVVLTPTVVVSPTVAVSPTVTVSPTVAASPTVAPSPTAVPTLARPTAVRPAAEAQVTLPTTRTIRLTGVIEMPQEAPPSAAMPRTITVVGVGTVRAAPDTVMALVGVETISDTVRLAADENAEIMDDVMAALRGRRIAQQDIQTTGFSVYSERQGPQVEGGPERIVYHVINNVRITVRRIDDLSAILDAAIGAGANTISWVNFSIDDPTPLVIQARELAMTDAMLKATALAELANVELGMVLQISESATPGGAVPMEAAARFGGGGPISAGEMEVTDQVQVVFAIQ